MLATKHAAFQEAGIKLGKRLSFLFGKRNAAGNDFTLDHGQVSAESRIDCADRRVAYLARKMGVLGFPGMSDNATASVIAIRMSDVCGAAYLTQTGGTGTMG